MLSASSRIEPPSRALRLKYKLFQSVRSAAHLPVLVIGENKQKQIFKWIIPPVLTTMVWYWHENQRCSKEKWTINSAPRYATSARSVSRGVCAETLFPAGAEEKKKHALGSEEWERSRYVRRCFSGPNENKTLKTKNWNEQVISTNATLKRNHGERFTTKAAEFSRVQPSSSEYCRVQPSSTEFGRVFPSSPINPRFEFARVRSRSLKFPKVP